MDIKIITSTNDIEKYRNFWPSMSKNWEKLYGLKPTIGFITEREESDELVTKMKHYGDVKLFKPIKGIPTPNQAKVARMWLSTQEQSETVMLVDIDMYILNKGVIDSWIDSHIKGKITAVGANAYFNSPAEGKFPMCYTIGEYETFKSIINPNNLGYEDLMLSWCRNVIDNKENLKNSPSIFSDESLLRLLIKETGNEKLINHTYRDDFVGMQAKRRLSRISFNVDRQKLNNGFYIDCAPERPLVINNMNPIFKHIGIEEKDWKL